MTSTTYNRATKKVQRVTATRVECIQSIRTMKLDVDFPKWETAKYAEMQHVHSIISLINPPQALREGRKKTRPESLNILYIRDIRSGTFSTISP